MVRSTHARPMSPSLLPDRTRSYPYAGDPKVTTPELYDLESDVSETTNVADQRPEVVRKLRELAKVVPSQPDPPRGRKKKAKAG